MKYGLKYFIYRTRFLLLYRDAYKFSLLVKNPQMRSELRVYLRGKFEDSRHIAAQEGDKRDYLLAVLSQEIKQYKTHISVTL